MASKNTNLPPEVCRDLIHLLHEANHAHRQVCERAIGKMGVHRSQHKILMHLSHCETPPSQKELATVFGISPAAVTVSLRKLELAGYITRQASSADGRVNQIRITDAGRCVVEASHLIFSGVDNYMLSQFSVEEIGQMRSFLDRILENLKTMETKNLDPKDYGTRFTADMEEKKR